MLTYRRKMNLFKKIAVTAVSALALSGVSVITSAPANAAITGILSVDTVPNRSSSLSSGVASATAADNKVSVSMIALSDTSGASETVTVRGRIISNPTPLTVDATSQITVGDTLVALATLSNNTAATIHWRHLKDSDDGFDKITYYNFSMGVYNEITSDYDFFTLFIAEQPTYNNFTYNVTGLIQNQKYAFKYSASNAFGESSESSLQYISPGGYP
jgi:hypothetical protein